MGDDQQTLLSRVGLWLGIIGFFVGLVSLVLWFPWYWPTVSVKASSEVVDPSAGMPLSFSIEDESILEAHSVRYRCYFGHIRSLPPTGITMNDGYTNEWPVADVLLPHDPVEVSCLRFGLPAVEADVAILVSFRPSFDWRRSSACGRYILRKNAGGQLAWFRKSSAPCAELAKCLDKREAEGQKYREAAQAMAQAIGRGIPAPWPTAPKVISCLPRE